MRYVLSLLLLSILMTPAAAQVAGCSGDVCPALLELESIEVDASEGPWEVSDGKIVETTAEGSVGTFTWTEPPKTITAQGFTLDLTVAGTASKDHMYPVIIYASGPFAFDPDPPQQHVYLNGNSGEETLTVTVKPLSAQLAGGLYTLDIGAAYGKVVHYVYRTVPQLIQ
jgi:hypothetical protein